jgi:peptide/nickel transport system ATP-binding protein/oligopeptide transport system ATP-binding protein
MTTTDQPVTPVLTVTGLRKEFRVHAHGAAKTITAIDGLDLSIRRGETVALVGESGSGKSTVARCIARLVQPTGGEVSLDGVSLPGLRGRDLTRVYAGLQMVFQDPNSSLNPRMTVADMLDEPLRLHTGLDRAARQRRVAGLVESVGLDRVHLGRYPNQLSGGQRQRVGIARAFAADPKVVLLDEPTASLDVSVRGQVIELLRRLQRERNIGYLFISHDLQVVRRLAHRVMVMYLGRVVEEGPVGQVFSAPAHPYTRALLSAAPEAVYGRVKQRFMLHGEVPSPIDLPPGCRLADRCPLVRDSCRAGSPPMAVVSAGHTAACPVAVADAVPAG